MYMCLPQSFICLSGEKSVRRDKVNDIYGEL